MTNIEKRTVSIIDDTAGKELASFSQILNSSISSPYVSESSHERRLSAYSNNQLRPPSANFVRPQESSTTPRRLTFSDSRVPQNFAYSGHNIIDSESAIHPTESTKTLTNPNRRNTKELTKSNRRIIICANVGLLSLGVFLVVLAFLVILRVGFVDTALEEAQDHYMESLQHFNVKSQYDPSVFGPAVDSYAIVALSLGCLLGVLALTCLAGVILAQSNLLTKYVILCTITLVVEIFQINHLYSVRNMGMAQMYDSLADYVGLTQEYSPSSRWDVLMTYLDCCGVTGYNDFLELKTWSPEIEQKLPVYLGTPLSCCKGVPLNSTCAEIGTLSPEINNMNIGCFDVLFDAIFHHELAYIFIVLLIVTQLVGIICTVWLLMLMPESGLRALVDKYVECLRDSHHGLNLKV